MQYVSPLSLLPEGTKTELSPRDLKLAKQRLMAEFELTGDTTIDVNGKELSRSDVLKLFDRLEQADDLAYNALVASDPVLLHFLEQHEMRPGTNFSLPEEKLTPEFIEWISPYFAWAFRKATTRIFRTVNRTEFDTLVVNRLMMTDTDEWEAWDGVEQHMADMLAKFETIVASKYQTPSQIETFTNYDLICLLCNLPEERFMPLMNDYAFELMQLAILEFNRKKRHVAFELMAYARSLRVHEDVMQQLLDKEAEMTGLVRDEKKQENKQFVSNAVRVVLIILFVLTRLATCHG